MWRTAIKNHKLLMEERTDASFWSDNIIDATKCIVDTEDWKKFYLYLCQSPVFFNRENPEIVQTLGDLEHLPQVPPYGPDQEVEIVENGTDRIIIVKNVSRESPESDDEKVES